MSQRVIVEIVMTSGEDIEQDPVAWERVMRQSRVIAPDDVVTRITITEEE